MRERLRLTTPTSHDTLSGHGDTDSSRAGLMIDPSNPLPQRSLKPWQVAIAFVVIGVGAQGMALVFAVAAMVVGSMRATSGGAPTASQPQLPAWGMAVAVLGSSAVLVLGSFATAWIARVPVRAALGLRSPPPLVYLLACLAAVSASPVGGLFVGIAKAVAPGFTFGTLDTMSQQVGAIPLWLAIPVFAFLPGISEETLFRGLLQRAIRRPWLAVSLSGLLFAAYHVDPHHAAGTLPIGLLLAWLAWRTDSLLVPIAGHTSFNLFAIVLQRFAGPDTQDDGLSAASVGLAAAGALVAVLCTLGISRLLPATSGRAQLPSPA